jgi:hypothetical protein
MSEYEKRNDIIAGSIAVLVVIIVTLFLKDSQMLISLANSLGVDSRLLGGGITFIPGAITLLALKRLLRVRR